MAILLESKRTFTWINDIAGSEFQINQFIDTLVYKILNEHGVVPTDSVEPILSMRASRGPLNPPQIISPRTYITGYQYFCVYHTT